MRNTCLGAARLSFVKPIAAAFLFLLAMTALCHGQQGRLQPDKSKNPGLRASASCSFSDGKTVHTDYLRPSEKGHKTNGAPVPDGQKWFFGADSAPSFITNADLTVGGEDVPAGSYTLSAIPSADKWTLVIRKLVIRKETGNQTKREEGVQSSDDEESLRVEMKVSKTPAAVEEFTIAYDSKDGRCTLRISSENTQAWVEVAEKRLCWPTTSPLTYQCPDPDHPDQ
jgi:predicted DNA binding CopG/RHH family protein